MVEIVAAIFVGVVIIASIIVVGFLVAEIRKDG